MFEKCFEVTRCCFVSEPTCDVQVDLCFLIDSTGSIRGNKTGDGSHDNWLLQLEFLAQLVDNFALGINKTRVGAVIFSEQANLAFALNKFTDAEALPKCRNIEVYKKRTLRLTFTIPHVMLQTP